LCNEQMFVYTVSAQNDPAMVAHPGSWPNLSERIDMQDSSTIPQGPNPSGLCMCGCGQKTTISSRNRYGLGRFAGQPTRYCVGHQRRESQADRFWSHVHKRTDTGCWEWSASVGTSGYGQFAVGRDMRRAHRVAWELERGPITGGLCVLHVCDNRLCVNPSHLFLGTRRDNHLDMVSKNRQRIAVGEQASHAKLTEDDVRRIRLLLLDGRSTRSIARDFGVSGSAIWAISAGKSWAHIGHAPIRRKRKGR
jgi:hypothetical protein